jgi:hypothetical protein
MNACYTTLVHSCQGDAASPMCRLASAAHLASACLVALQVSPPVLSCCHCSTRRLLPGGSLSLPGIATAHTTTHSESTSAQLGCMVLRSRTRHTVSQVTNACSGISSNAVCNDEVSHLRAMAACVDERSSSSSAARLSRRSCKSDRAASRSCTTPATQQCSAGCANC